MSPVTRDRNTLLIAAGVVVMLGVLAVWTASSFAAMRVSPTGDSLHYLKGHLMRVFVGLVVGIIAWRMRASMLQFLAVPAYFAALALLALTVVASGSALAPEINGSTRWLHLGPVRLLPSELMRYGYVLLSAFMASRSWWDARKLWHFGLMALAAVIPMVLILSQPDFSGSAYLGAVMMVMLLLAGARFKHLVLLGGVAALFAAAAVFSSPYRMDRVTTGMDGSELSGSGYQSQQACIALGSGGLLGRGLGRGRQQRGFLPEAFSDYILAVIGEEAGFVGAVMVLSCLALVCTAGWRIAVRADTTFCSMVSGGFTAVIAIGVLIHAGVVTKLLPPTGIPLPLVSWGGTGIVMTMGALGFLAGAAGRRRQ